MSRLAASVALAGVALIGVSAPAVASKGHDKPAVCHPTGKGWVLIKPSQASSHIDEAKFPNGHYWKHEHSGRHDVYAVSGACPVEPSTPSPTTTGGTPSTPTTSRPTSTPSTGTPTTQTTRPTAPSPSQTSSTPTKTSDGGGSSPSARPPKPSAPQTGSLTPSPITAMPSPASPRRSVPSSTVAPPNQLARTGADIGSLLVLAAILLVGGAFILISRKGGQHR